MLFLPASFGQFPGQLPGSFEVMHRLQGQYDFHVDDALEVVEIDSLYRRFHVQALPALFQAPQ